MTRASTRKRRQSAAVYRRRRLALLLGVLLVAGGIAWVLIAQPWQTFAAAWEKAAASPSPTHHSAPPTSPAPTTTAAVTPTETPSDTPTPGVTTPAAVGTAGPCVSSDIFVEALADADTYASGRNPALSIRLTNQGAEDCTLNVGTATQMFTVTSGSDVWWRSTDCQTEPSDMIVTLAAGQTVTSAAPVVWDRTRSSVSTCGTGNRPVAPAGGASYHVTVEIGGIPSSDSKQILLY